MAVTIILAILILLWFGINLRKMVNNVKNGRSIDGCNGDCGHCRGCHSKASHSKKRIHRKRQG